MEHNILLNEVVGRVKPLVLDWLVVLPLTHSHTSILSCPTRGYPKPCLLGTLGSCNITFQRDRLPLPTPSTYICLPRKIHSSHVGQHEERSLSPSNHALSTTYQGRATPHRGHPAEAECHPGRRLRLLRARLPAAPPDAGRSTSTQSVVRRLLLFQKETARRHAVPEERQEAVRRGRGRRRRQARVQQGRAVLVHLHQQSEQPRERPGAVRCCGTTNYGAMDLLAVLTGRASTGLADLCICFPAYSQNTRPIASHDHNRALLGGERRERWYQQRRASRPTLGTKLKPVATCQGGAPAHVVPFGTHYCSSYL